MKRIATILAMVFSVVALVIITLLPAATRRTAAPPATTIRGVFHVHSNRSDGSGSVDAIAEAAQRAGLQFVILTDHGDGTRSPDPPSYRSGVLTIDGLELSTSSGHYAAIGLPVSPYPIAGTPEDVIEDVRRLGGFGIAAHPGSPRPSLSWQGWDTPFDGLEWINGDSEWRDESRMPIARALLTYLIRAPQSLALLLDRPDRVLHRWDALAIDRKIVGLAGTDAHARLGFRQRTDPDASSVHVRLPGYESSFRALSNHVVLETPLSGDATIDARALMQAIRSGHVYSVIDALATPGSLSFTATSGSQSAGMGDSLVVDGDVLLHAASNAPPGTTLVLLRNGQRLQEVTDGPIQMNGGIDRGVYRIEGYTSGSPGGPAVPWIVSNPIYVGLDMKPAVTAALPEPVSRIPARTSEASAESGPNDTSAVETGPLADPRARTFAGAPGIQWSFALAPGTAVGQFAAVRVPVSGGLESLARVRFRVSASRPMRIWAQLRAPVGNTERWGRTFYVDEEPRLVDITLPSFKAIGVTSTPNAPLNRVDSLLFVVDTLNTLPGSRGSINISEIGFVK
jgi:hypothetical protein